MFRRQLILQRTAENEQIQRTCTAIELLKHFVSDLVSLSSLLTNLKVFGGYEYTFVCLIYLLNQNQSYNRGKTEENFFVETSSRNWVLDAFLQVGIVLWLQKYSLCWPVIVIVVFAIKCSCILVPRATILLTCGRDRELWLCPTLEVHDLQIWQMWLTENMKQILCACSENWSGQSSRYLLQVRMIVGLGDESDVEQPEMISLWGMHEKVILRVPQHSTYSQGLLRQP